MIRCALMALALTSTMLAPAPLMAQQAPNVATAEQTALERRSAEIVAVLNGTLTPEAVFTEGFLKAVPVEQLTSLSASLTTQFGPAVEVALLNPRDGTRAALEIRFERGIAKGGIAIAPGEENRVSELLFNAVEAVAVAGDIV